MVSVEPKYLILLTTLVTCIIMNDLINRITRIFNFLVNVENRVSALERAVSEQQSVPDTTQLDNALGERGF